MVRSWAAANWTAQEVMDVPRGCETPNTEENQAISGKSALPQANSQKTVQMPTRSNHPRDASTENPATKTTQLPQYDTIIINCDGSYKRHKDLASIGYVLKKRDDTIVEEHHTQAKPATTNVETEAHACLESIRAAKKYNPSFIILYSDCEPVIEKVKTGSPKGKKDIYLQIKSEIRDIKIFRIKHTPRENNKEAHRLAKTEMHNLEEKSH